MACLSRSLKSLLILYFACGVLTFDPIVPPYNLLLECQGSSQGSLLGTFIPTWLKSSQKVTPEEAALSQAVLSSIPQSRKGSSFCQDWERFSQYFEAVRVTLPSPTDGKDHVRDFQRVIGYLKLWDELNQQPLALKPLVNGEQDLQNNHNSASEGGLIQRLLKLLEDIIGDHKGIDLKNPKSDQSCLTLAFSAIGILSKHQIVKKQQLGEILSQNNHLNIFINHMMGNTFKDRVSDGFFQSSNIRKFFEKHPKLGHLQNLFKCLRDEEWKAIEFAYLNHYLLRFYPSDARMKQDLTHVSAQLTHPDTIDVVFLASCFSSVHRYPLQGHNSSPMEDIVFYYIYLFHAFQYCSRYTFIRFSPPLTKMFELFDTRFKYFQNFVKLHRTKFRSPILRVEYTTSQSDPFLLGLPFVDSFIDYEPDMWPPLQRYKATRTEWSETRVERAPPSSLKKWREEARKAYKGLLLSEVKYQANLVKEQILNPPRNQHEEDWRDKSIVGYLSKLLSELSINAERCAFPYDS